MKKPWSKLLSLLLSALMTVSLFSIPAYAESAHDFVPVLLEEPQIEAQSANAPVITPFNISIQQVYIDLQIDNRGNASVSTSCFSWYSTHKIYVTATLQKVSGVQTSDITSWYGNDTWSASCTGSTNVSSGSYRVKVSASVYDSNNRYLETVTSYSGTKSY